MRQQLLCLATVKEQADLSVVQVFPTVGDPLCRFHFLTLSTPYLGRLLEVHVLLVATTLDDCFVIKRSDTRYAFFSHHHYW